MDEVNRTKALLASILSRTASIKLTTNELSNRLDTLKTKSEEKVESPESICPLYDLPNDCLRICLQGLGAKDIAALSRTCRYMRDFIFSDEHLWRAKLKDEFSVVSNLATDPDIAHMINEESLGFVSLKMEHLTGKKDAPEKEGGFSSEDEESDLDEERRSTSGQSSSSAQEDAPAPPPVFFPWRNIYMCLARFQTFVFRHVSALQAAKHPSEVSGAQHRKEILTAMRLLERFIRGPLVHVHVNKLRQLGAGSSFVALLNSEHFRIRDLSGAILSHLVKSPELNADLRQRGVSRTLNEYIRLSTLNDLSLISSISYSLASLTFDAREELSIGLELAGREGLLTEYEIQDPIDHTSFQPQLVMVTLCSKRGSILERRIFAVVPKSHAPFKELLQSDENGNVLQRGYVVNPRGKALHRGPDGSIRFLWELQRDGQHFQCILWSGDSADKQFPFHSDAGATAHGLVCICSSSDHTTSSSFSQRSLCMLTVLSRPTSNTK